jgi:hypothetical protein
MSPIASQGQAVADLASGASLPWSTWINPSAAAGSNTPAISDQARSADVAAQAGTRESLG